MSTDTQLTRTIQNWSEVFTQHSFHEFKHFMDVNGLSSSQVIALFRLYHRGPCGVSAIGSQLGVTNAASSQLIDRLVLLGLIERTEDPSDRRQKQLTITDKGKALLEQGIASRRQWMEKLTTQLNPEQQETIIIALRVLTDCALQAGEEE